jgi:hypothetical protein
MTKPNGFAEGVKIFIPSIKINTNGMLMLRNSNSSGIHRG